MEELKLELVEEFKKEEGQYQNYEIGRYEVQVSIYEWGKNICVFPKDCRDYYLPNIYYVNNTAFDENAKERFTIASVSYGSVEISEMQQIVEAYEHAVKVAKLLEAEFIKKGE